MTYIWSLRNGILDALKDDGESIIQILEYLNYLNIKCSRELLKAEISSLLNDDLIKVVYPSGLSAKEFDNALSENLQDFWFELTPNGEAEWGTIDSL